MQLGAQPGDISLAARLRREVAVLVVVEASRCAAGVTSVVVQLYSSQHGPVRALRLAVPLGPLGVAKLRGTHAVVKSHG